MERHEVDAVVVGAGSSGAAAAWMLAEGGLRVALLERRALEHAGPGHHNAVPLWMFDVAGVPRPQPPERATLAGAFSMRSADGRQRLALPQNPIQSLHMRRLVARLQGYARAAGVALLDRVEIDELILDGDRPRELVVWHRPVGAEPAEMTLRADLFVDATGMHGALRRRTPALAHCTPEPGREHICVAAQQIRAVADPGGARAFLARNDLAPGEAMNWTGLETGWSTLAVTVDPSLEHVDLLTGTTADHSITAPTETLKALAAREPWIGRRVSGGAGPIPLRRPYDRLAVPGIALVGNAACQVFPAHGSGVGIGLIAARLLADAATRDVDPGSRAATWRYQATFQRRYGGLLAAYDVFRRMAQSMRGDDIGALLGAGLIGRSSAEAGLDERMPPVDAEMIAATLRGAREVPGLVSRMAPGIARMQAVHALYRQYPPTPSVRRLRWWSHTAGRLFGERPDLP